MISGSGIPQVEGMIIGYIKVNWLRVLLLKLTGDYLVVLADEDKATEIKEILLNMTQR